MEKFLSRKFLFPLVTAVAVFLTDLFGVELNTETIYGLAIAALGYAGVEGMVDRKAIMASAEAMKGDTMLAMQALIDSLQRELASHSEQTGPTEGNPLADLGIV